MAPDWAARVVAPMSDGLSAVERTRLAASRDSFLSVTRPVPAELDSGATAEWLVDNRGALGGLIDRDAYSPAAGPRLLVYRMHVADRQHTGLIVEVAAAAFADHRVRGHESVHADRVDSLIRQYEAVPVQAELVALLHDHDDYVEGLIEAALASTPVLAFQDVAGVGQEVWEIRDATIVEATVAHLTSLGLYIADGHHRVAAAVRRWELGGCDPRETVLAIAYPEHQLHLLAFHRYLRGPVDATELLEAARAVADVAAVESSADIGRAPRFESGTVGCYVAGAWWAITWPEPFPPGAAGLDVSLLHQRLLQPLVGWELGARLETSPELLGLAHLIERADAEAGAVFALTPPTIVELMDVADRGEVMLAKSTFFDPKPRGGLVLLGET